MIRERILRFAQRVLRDVFRIQPAAYGPAIVEAGWFGREPEWDERCAERALALAQVYGFALLWTGNGDVYVFDDDTVEIVLERWKARRDGGTPSGVSEDRWVELLSAEPVEPENAPPDDDGAENWWPDCREIDELQAAAEADPDYDPEDPS